MCSERIDVTYDVAKNLLEPADICLFRGSGLISRFIKTFSQGNYTHIGLVSVNHNIELVEIREFYGGRIINLEREIIKRPGKIDVYRCVEKAWKIDYDGLRINKKEIELDKKAIVNCMRRLAGSSYNYNNIWQIAKRNIPGLRFFYSWKGVSQDKQVKESVSHICSSAVANCFSKNKFDLVLNKNDAFVTPNNIANSPYLNYLFTLYPGLGE